MARMSPRERAQLRETAEPEELRNPIPWPVAVIAVAFVLWGAWYYFQNTGYPIAAGDRRSVMVTAAAGSVDGANLYTVNCASCHQASGQGLAGVFPPLAGSRWVLENDARLVQILLHGINGAIEVRGVTYQGVMPAFPQLSNEELAAVLSHIRASWGNSADPIDAGQIAAGRERFPEREVPWGGSAELDQTFPPG